MKLRKFAVIAAMGLCAAGSAWAKDYQAGQVEIDDLWVRASAPGQSNGAGYMEIDNKATAADRLLSVSSRRRARRAAYRGNQGWRGQDAPGRGRHRVARRRRGQAGPGRLSRHVPQAESPFAEGAAVPATLKFEKAGEVAVQFKVKPAAHNPGMSHDHSSMKH